MSDATLDAVHTLADLDVVLEASAERPLVLLKHSTRCPVSFRAQAEFERFAAQLEPDAARAAIVYVVEDRAVSNAIAERLGVAHESPQALVIRDGEVVWHDSHERVEAARLRSALEDAGP